MITKNSANVIAVYKLLLLVSVISSLSLGLASCNTAPKDKNEKKSEVSNSNSSYDSDITREFAGVKTVTISTVSGNCRILKSDNPRVNVSLSHQYKPADTFEPVIKQKGDELKLQEKMLGSNSGYSNWILWIPEQTNINFKSASGSLTIENVSGKIIARTYSGTIGGSGIKILEKSIFTSASGNVAITFSESPKFDVLIYSASGNASIDYNNNQIIGTIEMKARVDLGKIDCPLKFDIEKEKFDGNHDYMIKRVLIKNESPIIKIHTASGEAILKE